MRSSAFYTVLGCGVLVVAGIIWWGTSRHAPVTTAPSVATSTSPETTPSVGDSIYTNGAYGFSIMYPGSATIQTTFDTSYHLAPTWRFDALPNATGTPIIQITGYKTVSTTSYPRYFEALVRVGASSDAKEVAECTSAGSGESALPSRTINGTVWHAFTLQSAGMQQYAQGVSYRVVQDGSCIALESVNTGSSYKDATSTADIPETTLTQQYKNLDAIVASMTFARP